MLNLDRNNAVRYTDDQQAAIDNLINNCGTRTGRELWADKGPGDILVKAKENIKTHCLDIQKARCAFCETLLEYGGVHIEHFANKGKYKRFLYEPLNLVCSCPVCNGFAKKGTKDTILGPEKAVYADNSFIYVHPYFDDPSKEIRYKDVFKLIVDKERSTKKGKKTIEMFHWDTYHATLKRLSNLVVRPFLANRQKLMSEILNYK